MLKKILLFLCIFTLVGCGTNSGDNPSPTPNPPTPGPTPDPAGAPVFGKTSLILKAGTRYDQINWVTELNITDTNAGTLSASLTISSDTNMEFVDIYGSTSTVSVTAKNTTTNKTNTKNISIELVTNSYSDETIYTEAEKGRVAISVYKNNVKSGSTKSGFFLDYSTVGNYILVQTSGTNLQTDSNNKYAIETSNGKVLCGDVSYNNHTANTNADLGIIKITSKAVNGNTNCSSTEALDVTAIKNEVRFLNIVRPTNSGNLSNADKKYLNNTNTETKYYSSLYNSSDVLTRFSDYVSTRGRTSRQDASIMPDDPILTSKGYFMLFGHNASATKRINQSGSPIVDQDLNVIAMTYTHADFMISSSTVTALVGIHHIELWQQIASFCTANPSYSSLYICNRK